MNEMSLFLIVLIDRCHRFASSLVTYSLRPLLSKPNTRLTHNMMNKFSIITNVLNYNYLNPHNSYYLS